MNNFHGKTALEIMPGFFRKNDQKGLKRNASEYPGLIMGNPLDAGLHFAYGMVCIDEGQYNLGISVLRTAVALGMDPEMVIPGLEKAQAGADDIKKINHNRYYRMKTLADAISQTASEHAIDMSKLSVLDLGGGDGLLCRMIPDVEYCLADPVTNGISAFQLPFSDKSFDIVVANHVFEHIHISRREEFLDSLCSKARVEVILLNPFFAMDTMVRERLLLFLKITGAEWAKEHLECQMPYLDEITDYAGKRNLAYRVKPNGTMAVTMAIEYADYFANKAGCGKDMETINTLYNEGLYQILDNTEYPNAYLVRIDIKQQSSANK